MTKSITDIATATQPPSLVERQLAPDPNALASVLASEAASSLSYLNPLVPADTTISPETTISSRVAAFTTTKLVTKVETFRQAGDQTYVHVTTETRYTQSPVATTIVTSGSSSASDQFVRWLANFTAYPYTTGAVVSVLTFLTWVIFPSLVDKFFERMERRRAARELHGPTPAF